MHSLSLNEELRLLSFDTTQITVSTETIILVMRPNITMMFHLEPLFFFAIKLIIDVMREYLSAWPHVMRRVVQETPICDHSKRGTTAGPPTHQKTGTQST
ncbi:hypothetical protein QR680_015125 [Steinernema hermaphroditum]|uniref:Uncharacterized protein n=1 Tax=Steinernema hermaphroditum TaxID=289476 RepID=A0AA39M4D9_9BILA|nr:hypothetical protein QR680_015125 [Steinernema hermaphroditum]